MLVFRENTEGLYAGVGGNFKKGTADEIAINEDVNTRKGVERILRAAFEAARGRRKKVCMSDKANALDLRARPVAAHLRRAEARVSPTSRRRTCTSTWRRWRWCARPSASTCS